jgi:hypothetical protein
VSNKEIVILRLTQKLIAGRIFVASLLAVGMISACSKTNNISQSETTNNSYSAVVGKKGGSVGDIATVAAVIPANAVPGDVEFTITEAADDEYPALPSVAVGKVYSFEPHGIEFDAEVDVYLPRPGSGEYVIWHAPPGGTWENLGQSGVQKATSVHTKTLSFSYFVVGEVANNSPRVGAGGGLSGASAGTASIAPSGGVAGVAGVGGAAVASGGTPGAGGDPGIPPDMPVGDAGAGGNSATGGTGGVAQTGGTAGLCSPASAEEGIVDSVGELKDSLGDPVPNRLKGGFAVWDTTEPDPQLVLVFSEYPDACGVALGMHGISTEQQSSPSGRASATMLTVNLRVDPSDAANGVMATTYPRAAKADELMTSYFVNDGICRGADMAPQDSASNKLSIMKIDSTTVQGELSLDQAGVVATSTFTFPFCPLPDAPSGPQCCL